MKAKTLIFNLLAFGCWLLASGATAQEVVDIQLLKNARDTTYRFCEIQTKDGDTVGIRYFPQAWTKKAEFQNFAYRLAQAETERRQEFDRLQKMAQKNVNYFAGIVDSIGGAGTFAGMQHQQLKEKMQGAWTLVTRVQGADEPEITTCMIQGDNLATKDKNAVIEWTNGETFRLKSGGLFAFNLNFKQVAPDRYVAERTVDGKTNKYVLKR